MARHSWTSLEEVQTTQANSPTCFNEILLNTILKDISEKHFNYSN